MKSIDEMTIKEANEELKKTKDRHLELSEALNRNESLPEVSTPNSINHPYEIGKNYLIRTVTMIQVGKLLSVFDKELVLDDAAWVPNTGRFNEALKDGIESSDSSEIELFKSKIIVGRGALIDCCVYNHELPTKNK